MRRMQLNKVKVILNFNLSQKEILQILIILIKWENSMINWTCKTCSKILDYSPSQGQGLLVF